MVSATGGVRPADWVPRTKLLRPDPPPDAVVDPALVARAVASLGERPLTLVTGEAGSGKTTLAAAAAAAVAAPVAWIALDDLDDDPLALVHLLVLALHGVVPGGCPAAAELAGSGLPAADDALRLAGVLLNDLLAAAPAEVVVVLDDLHALRDAATLRVLDHALARIPPNVHLLATARTEPALALARLRARGQVGDIGAEDLRLTTDQAVVLCDRLGLTLDRAQVERLVEASAGWVTGLRLLAGSAGPSARPLPDLRGPSGADALDAYLAAEVVGAEPAEIQRFLLDSSVLDDLDPAVVAGVTGRADAGALLGNLAARHRLLVRVADPDRPAYRYHDLLRSFLRRRLRAAGGGRLAALHLAAARAVPSATRRVEHLLAAGEWDEAASEVESLAPAALWRPGELQRLAAWVGRIPPATAQRRTGLRLVVGVRAAQRGDMVRAVEALEPVVAMLDPAGPTPPGGAPVAAGGPPQAEFTARWVATRCMHLATNDHRRYAPVLAALEADPRFAGLPVAAQADHHLSTAYGCLFTGRWDEVARRVETVVGLVVASGDVAAAEVLAQHLSPLLAPAEGVLDAVEAYAGWTDRSFPDGPPLVRLGAGHQRAFIALLRARFDDALSAAREAGDGPERLGGLPYLRATLDWVLAGTAFARDDLHGAGGLLRAAVDRPDATDLDRDLDVLRRALLARVLRRQDRRRELADLAEVAEAAERSAGRAPGGGRYRDHAVWAAASVRAQQAWADGDPTGAAAVLQGALGVEDRLRLVPFAGSLYLDLALVLEAAGGRARALAALAEAASRANRWNLPGLLAAAGPEAVPLLGAAAGEGLGGSAVRTALAALGERPPSRPVPVPGSALVLTPRELEVLRLLETGASNQAIAGELIVSENTVKTHVRSLLTKLGARSRGGAVAAARRLRLL